MLMEVIQKNLIRNLKNLNSFNTMKKIIIRFLVSVGIMILIAFVLVKIVTDNPPIKVDTSNFNEVSDTGDLDTLTIQVQQGTITVIGKDLKYTMPEGWGITK